MRIALDNGLDEARGETITTNTKRDNQGCITQLKQIHSTRRNEITIKINKMVSTRYGAGQWAIS